MNSIWSFYNRRIFNSSTITQAFLFLSFTACLSHNHLSWLPSFFFESKAPHKSINAKWSKVNYVLSTNNFFFPRYIVSPQMWFLQFTLSTFSTGHFINVKESLFFANFIVNTQTRSIYSYIRMLLRIFVISFLFEWTRKNSETRCSSCVQNDLRDNIKIWDVFL